MSYTVETVLLIIMIQISKRYCTTGKNANSCTYIIIRICNSTINHTINPKQSG